MKLNGILVNNIHNRGELKLFAMFIHIKSLHSNSVIYNCCHERLAAKSGLSISAARKYLKFFVDKGWVEVKNGNLHLKKFSALEKIKKNVFYKVGTGSVKEVLENLYVILLKHKHNQAKWYNETCHDLKNTHEAAYRRKIRNLDKKYPNFDEKRGCKILGEIGISNGFKISFSRIAEWLGCSVGTAHKIITALSRKCKIISSSGGWSVYHSHESYVRDKGFVSKKSGKFVVFHCNMYKF